MLNVDSSLLNIATPYSDSAVDSFRTDRIYKARLEEQQAIAKERDFSKKQDLLADPTKIDNMVANSMQDVYPFAKKAKGISTATDKSAFIDESLSDHPFQGSAGKIKSAFVEALNDPRFAGVDHQRLLGAIKQEHFNQVGEDGKTLLEKGHEYKYGKDNGPMRMNIPFIHEDKGDKNVVALPGYEEYKQQESLKHPYDTSLAEALTMQVVPTLALGALTIATGGAAAPAAIAGRVALSAALAYPEFKAFDYAANKVAQNNRNDIANPSGGDMLTELAVGGLAMAGAGLGLKYLGSKAFKAFSKTAEATEQSTALALKTGTAKDATDAYYAAGAHARAFNILEDKTAVLKEEMAKDSFKGKTVDMGATNVNGETVYTPRDFTGNNVVSPEVAEGLGKAATDAVEESPSKLFNDIKNPEAETRVLDDLAKGVPANITVPARYAQEAAFEAFEKGIEPSSSEYTKKVSEIATRMSQQDEALDAWHQSRSPFNNAPVSAEEQGIINGISSKKTYPGDKFVNTLSQPKPGEVAIPEGGFAFGKGKEFKVSPAAMAEEEERSHFGKAAFLIGTSVFAGGAGIFGMPSRSEASPGSAVVSGAEKLIGGIGSDVIGKAVGEGKKLFDGGIEFLATNARTAASKIKNNKISADVLETIDYHSSPRDISGKGVVPANKVLNTIIKASDNDPKLILQTLSEMGIDTEKRIAYHGTTSVESTLKGYSPEFTKSGIFNDEGEFAKYFASDPGVAGNTYAGGARLGNSYGEVLRDYFGNSANEITGASAEERLAGRYYMKANTEEEYKKVFDFMKTKGLSVESPVAPNVQKVLLDTKKTYLMQGKEVPEDVMGVLKEHDAYPGRYNNPDYAPFSSNQDAWEALKELPQKRLESQHKAEVDNLFNQFIIQKPEVLKEVEKDVGVSYTKFNTLTKLIQLNDLTYADNLSQMPSLRIDKILGEFRSTGNGMRGANDILRSLGYDSITHIGKQDGLVTIALKQGVEKPFFDGSEIASNVLKGVVGLAASIPLLSLFSPDEAQASPLSATATATSKAAATWAESLGLKGAELLKAFKDNHWYVEQVSQTQTWMPDMMEQVKTSPNFGRTMAAAKSVQGKTSTLLDGISKYLSNGNFAELYGTLTNNPAIQLASAQSAMSMNVLNAMQVNKNIAKLVPGLMEDAVKNHTEISEFMKPFQSAYDEVAIPLAKTEFEINTTKGSIADLKRAMKEEGVDPRALGTQLQEQEAKLEGLNKLFGEYNPGLESAKADLNNAQTEMARKYATSRISLAAEGKLDPSVILSYDEKAAVKMYQDMFEHYKVRSEAAGLETISGKYVRHSRDNTAVMKEFEAKLADLGIQSDTNGIPLTSFFSRSKYSEQMIPDILRNVAEYVPDAEKRINIANFWQVGSDSGWDAVAKNDLITGNKVWDDYFTRLKKAYNPAEDTLTNRMADRMSSLETLRLLAFSPSAPFKHLFKNEGTWATLGFTNSMKHIPDAVTTAIRVSTNNTLYKLGLEGKMLPKGALDDFTNSVMRQRQMLNPMADIERPDKIVGHVDRWLDKLNGVGGVGIQAVEAFDRVHTIQAAFDMSVKKGMTAEQAMSGIYGTILKNNFLGGALNPEWMHNPKIRLLALFQNTPFKILERRLTNGLKTMSDVQTAWGTVKNKSIPGLLTEMDTLLHDIAGGQTELKKNMIYDALTSTKDAYGNSVSAQFMREWLIAGAVTMAGGAVGLDFSKHSFHLPFIKDNKNDMAFATSPIVGAAWQTLHGGGADEKLPDDEKAFFPSRFYRNWLGTTGGAQPLMLHKMRRISNGDIPKIYQDSPLQYLFSVPSAGK